MWVEVDVLSTQARPLVRHGSVGTVGHTLRVCSRPPPWEVRAATKPPAPSSAVLPSYGGGRLPGPDPGDPVAGWGRQVVWLAGRLAGASLRRWHLARG